MAKEKKRGFFSWLGFGQKEQTPEKETEVQNEQPVVEEIVPAQEPVKASEQTVEEQPQAHTEAEAETFAADVVEVTEQVAESEKAQPEAVAEPEVITEPETIVEETPASVIEPEVTPEPVAIEREELPLPEDVNAEDVSPEEWQAEAETVEIVEAAEEEAAKEDITDEELEAQALAAEEAVIVVPPAEEEQPVEEIAQEQEKPTKEGFFARLKRSLLKTKENLGSGFISLFRGKKIDDDLFEELEEQLLIADVGVETTRKIITNLTEGATRKQLRDAEALYGLLKEEMGEILAKVDEPLNVEGKTPFVILMVGVNGVGKTTTIGKLARQFEQQGKSVMLAAGDTFRAAAVEQLQVWGQRNNIPVIAQHTGADSASVIFDAIQAAKARNIDVLIADTAGRLQNKSHLMEELKKIVRVMKKLDVEAPHEVMLTIDASTGQNAVSQAKLFHEAVGLTGITLTKLDGTAKGGVIFSVADQFGIPIRYIGVGERIEDLRPFKADDFIEALFARED
ncbi:signal recognition particle-docking protein FtsY [Escherichia coli]|uniref:signal recognition particle-docking protein FtsY n=1 Tax=Escherichia coli TaxID=562 RepID=UPI000699D768|nr:signal recognition particle-docking protein FtsY [Escherichia coli]EFB4086668.1 signal recognition particle-docking protein FtsY [Escherichia coli O33]EFE7008402.1 signal recognition particle-docking protein FtsY [Escherichia coli]EFG1125399.1 signal recognition particle-docking protein FtsY [Escherichia coli]EFJ5619917.1 signal recognition particle-docking protein FtsY [Escherichia coli]EFJ7021906.1 signal recognition particle-docking protein FtsY [Escherichia coli]